MDIRGSKDKLTSQFADRPLVQEKSAIPHHSGSHELSREHFSPVRLLAFIIISIFLAEVVAMIAVNELPSLPYAYVTLIDAGIMTILIFPMLYWLSFQPLISHIHRRQQAEQALQQINRALSVLKECNEVLVRAENETDLLQKMCEIIVHIGKYRMAWVGFAAQDETKSVHPAAQVGFEDGYLDSAQISWADNERGRGPTGTSIREGVVQVNQNFLTNPKTAVWRESALARGYQASIALPLQNEFATFGALTIYSEQSDSFDHQEVHLLQELANDLAFGILSLRERTERKHAEAAIRQLSSIVEQTEDTVVVTNCEGVIEYVNPAFERLTGYTKQEALGKTPRVIKSGIHDHAFYRNMWQTVLRGEVFQSEIANRKKNGELFYEVKTITPLRDIQGNITHLVATGKDITQHKLDEEKLYKAYEELEMRVWARTEELHLANAALEKEISERKQAEQAVRQNEAMLRAVLEQLPSGVTLRDASTGKIILSNVRSLEILHALADVPEQFAEYRGFHADGRAYRSEEWPIYRSMNTGELVNAEEIECERMDGTHFTISVNSAPIYDIDGKIISGVAVFDDITERKQVEKRLAYLASFPERNPNLVIEVDADGQVRYANPATLSAFPELLEQGTAHPWLAGLEPILHALQEGQTNVASRDVMVAGRVFQQSFYFLLQEKLVRIYGTDITERKQAEEALRESERRLNRAQEIAHLGSWELDLVKNQLTWSDEVYRIFGLQPQEFGATYEAFLEVVHPDDRAAVDAAYSGSIREVRDQYEIEHRVVRRSSGEIRVVHEKCEHFRDEAGQIIRSVGMVHDITERKLAEEALRRYELLSKHSRDIILFINLQDGRILEANAAAIQAYGYSRDELLVLTVEDLRAPDTKKLTAEQMAQAGTRGILFETVHVCKGGTTFPVEVSSQGANIGGVRTLISIIRDITERKQAEKLIERSRQKLNEILVSIQDDLYVLDRDWNFVYVSKLFSSKVGKEPEDFVGKNIWTMFPKHVGSMLQENFRAAMEKRETRRFEIGGKYTSAWYRMTAFPSTEGITVLGTDITERKRAEEALQAAHDELELRVQERTEELATANMALLKEIAERKEIEQQLRIQTTAMEAAANGIVITDHEGNVQWANPALVQISGYNPHDLIGQNMRIFKSGQNDPRYYSEMWNTILSGQVWRGETINRRKDGNLYIEEQTITPVRDESGQIPHFIAIKQDITRRKEDERELERRNQELQIISNAERNQRQFSEALVAAALNLNKSLKLSDVLSLILEQIREVIPYQLADITLLEGESFYDASHRGDLPWPGSLLGTNNRFLLESFRLLNKIRQTGEPVLVPDTQKEPDWVLLEGFAWTRSFLSAPLLAEKKVIGFVNLFSDQPEFFAPEMSNRLVAFAAHAAVAIQNAWLFEQVQASTERLQSLSRRLVEIQENERLYISRELHDEAGQVLTSLLVDLRLLEKNISNPSKLQKIVTEMEGSLNGVIENLHRIAMALRPASLDHVGLVAALRQHTESIAEKNGLSISFTANGVITRLPANIETVIYRIVQEALTNIVRHAHASRVDVVLTVRDGKLIVIIEDDGIGFDTDVDQPDKHLGLFGMRERIEMIDGKLIIESSPGIGTTIMMEVGYADTISSRG